ncbi:MAG TPA: hypothetical protein VFA98_13220 [Thermoanaerobaculia bacterium]|jgi:hypothetical protein|nr:hypothetical protein [Thermoanaerobaculia bacterium]
MSARDVSATARAWLDAIAARDAAYDGFDGKVESYQSWQAKVRAEEDARRAHLAAVVDAPNDGVPDDARIARLRAENVRLAEKVKSLKHQVTMAKDNNETRNRELDALHYVWCDGGCEGGVHRYEGSPDAVTEEIVQLAERSTSRLRRWFENRKAKKARGL